VFNRFHLLLALVLVAATTLAAAADRRPKPLRDDAVNVADAGRNASEAERLSGEVRRVFSTMKSSEYSHKTEVDEQQGKYFLDCSGLACYVLQHEFPQHYKAIPFPGRRARPLAADFCRFFKELPVTPLGRNGWQRIASLLDAQPGDIVAWESYDPKTGSTGHVVFVDGTPVRLEDGQVRVEVIDSTRHGHGDDTRKADQTGLGRGTMWFTVDDEGQPTGYRWSRSSGKLQQRPIAIGRIVELVAAPHGDVSGKPGATPRP
jgi:hypothetical protein